MKKQVKDRFEQLNMIGESRHKAKQDYRENVAGGKFEMNRTMGVHSKETLKTYRNSVNKFIEYMQEFHPDIKNLDQITKEHGEEYIRYRAENGKAATTYSKDISALNKCFKFGLTKKEIGVDSKKFADYTNNRELKSHHERINLNNYKNEILLGWATGMRRESYSVITKSSFRFDLDGLVKDLRLKEKGGKERCAVVLEEHRQAVTDFLNSLDIDDKTPILKSIPNIFPAHRVRQVYAQDLYKQTTLEIGEENYEKGYLGYDKNAVLKVSKNLGHNREDVVKNYLHVATTLDVRAVVYGRIEKEFLEF